MREAKRVRLVEKNSENESKEPDTTECDWGNLPYPAIQIIAKVDL